MKFHWDQISALAKVHHMEDPTAGLPQFVRFLQFWWCQKYNRPLKDPLLQSYSINELLYEYLRYYYAIPENDPKKQLEAKQVADEDEDWIRQQLMKVQEAAKTVQQVNQAIDKQASPEKPLGEAGDVPVPSAMPDLPEISTKFDE